MKDNKFVEKINSFFQGIPLCIYILPYILYVITVNFLHSKKDSIKLHKPLYDIIISNSPDLSKYDYITNLLMSILLIYLIIPMFIKPNINVFISIFKYWSIIIFIRSITTSVTILPSIIDCDFKLDLFTFFNGHCIDKIFSGHTSFSLIVVFIYYKYNILSNKLIYFLLFIQTLIALSLILTRGHYTIDIVLGYIITIPTLLMLDL